MSNTNSEEMEPASCLDQQINPRAMRRALLEITPESSHAQLQSPLFAMLPSEVRNLIFEFVVCQTSNYSKPVSSTSHTHRPGHEYNTKIETALLLTCRLIYYETRAIPMRSTTHHIYEAPSESFNRLDWDHYLFHLSSQSGQNLYHLHITKWRSPFTFDDHLKPHLHWRKLTWTLCASEWTAAQIEDHFYVAGQLKAAVFPDSCQEVNLEFESLKKFPRQRRLLRDCVNECRDAQLSKRNGSKIHLDEAYTAEYTWQGTTWLPPTGDDDHWEGSYAQATYHVIRVCWRDQVPERAYMHYDRLNCLRSSSAVPFAQEDMSEDEND